MAARTSQTWSGNPPRWRPLLSSHVSLAQLFHLDLARDTGGLGMPGEDPLGEIPVSHIILATATQHSGRMLPTPGKEAGRRVANQMSRISLQGLT